MTDQSATRYNRPTFESVKTRCSRVRQQSSEIISSDRGVTISVEYVLALAVFISFTGALTAGLSGQVENSQQNVAQVEIDRMSADVAVAIEDVDEIVEQSKSREESLPAIGDDPNAAIEVELPDRMAGSSYVLRVDGGQEAEVTAETDLSAEQNIISSTEIETENEVSTLGGATSGPITVSYNTTSEVIEVKSSGA